LALDGGTLFVNNPLAAGPTGSDFIKSLFCFFHRILHYSNGSGCRQQNRRVND